jgi:hypothetical protein
VSAIDTESRLDVRIPAARAFVHTLNILIKYVRMYGFHHKRTETKFNDAWQELQAALPSGGGQVGLLLGVSGNKLLLDGIPLESGQSETGFARLLSAAGLASINFSSRVSVEDFAALVRAFAIGGSKAEALAEQIKAALGEESSSTIKINQIRFVAQDPSSGDVPLAAQIAAQTLGPEFRDWLNNPEKLLQLIAAAEGSKSGRGISGAVGQSGGQAVAPALTPLDEKEVIQGIRLLTKFGEVAHGGTSANLSGLPTEAVANDPNMRAVLQQMMDKLAANLPADKRDGPVLMRAAEHLAIRFALERYERGEVRVNAVHDMLEHMSRQMDTLRKVLRVHEEKMSRAGMLVESHADILDRQFWAEVPDAGKRAVLLSSDAACVPPRNVRSYVEELLQSEDRITAASILRNYCDSISSSDAESRRKIAMGLSQLTDLYGTAAPDLLGYAAGKVAEQLALEGSLETQSLLGAAFVRISQEASSRRQYGAIQRVLACIQQLERKRPVLAQELRPRVGVESRLAEFIEEALSLPHVPTEMIDALRNMPQAATDQLVSRFARCRERQECDRLVDVMGQLGQAGNQHLRELLRLGTEKEAAAAVGLISRLDYMMILELLPARLREWNRFYHDIVVRQIAASNAPERGQILLELLDVLDHMVLPQAVDEIGMSGDRTLGPALMVMAGDGVSHARSPFIQVKAIEALGRLRDVNAIPLLQTLVESRKMWKWVHPRELRVAAAQALLKIEPRCAPQLMEIGNFELEELKSLPLDPDSSKNWTRQRRYERIVPDRLVSAIASSSWGRSQIAVRELSMGGGVAAKNDDLRLGAEAALDLQLGMRHVHTQVLLRRARQGEISFEIVDIDLDERSKLRRILAGQLQRITAMA